MNRRLQSCSSRPGANLLQLGRRGLRGADRLLAGRPFAQFGHSRGVTAVALLFVVLAKLHPQCLIVAVAAFLLGGAVLAAPAFLYAMAPVAYPTLICDNGVRAVLWLRLFDHGSETGWRAQGCGPWALAAPVHLVPIAVVGGLCAPWLTWEAKKISRRRS